MQILFLDESGTAPDKSATEKNQYFVLGGLIVPEAQWKSLQADLDRLKREYRVDGEVKWRYFLRHQRGRRKTPLSHLEIEQLDELRIKLFEVIARYKSFKIIAAVVDTKLYYEKYPDANAEDMYHAAFEVICERFQYCLQDMQRATTGTPFYGMIVIDERNGPQNKQLDDFHYGLLTNHDRRRADYNNLVEGLFIAASHHSVGVQFADLVAGAVYRKISKDDSRFYDIIQANVRCRQNGDVNGYGIVSVPHGAVRI